MLSPDDAHTVARQLMRSHLNESHLMERYYRYAHGLAGVPEVPDNSGDEIQQLARLSVKNVIGMVVDTFTQNLSVVGVRGQGTKQAWADWQKHRLDARQGEVHRTAVTYGAGYVVALPAVGGLAEPVVRTRSPRQLIATYADPHVDAWPAYALETWVTEVAGKKVRAGLLLDAEAAYPVNFGSTEVIDGREQMALASVGHVGRGVPHGLGVCPVVRYINDRDAEDLVRGEVEPLILPQRALNEVNFDRMIVSRFGAFPQKVISNWKQMPDSSEVQQASSRRVWAFEDDVKAQSLPAAAIAQYDGMLSEMIEHIAMIAQVSPTAVTGKMVNLSAEALAAGEKNQQRKLDAKRESFGESHEQLLGLLGRIGGYTVSPNAEVQWRDTEARSFGAVVDGIVKLAQIRDDRGRGIPIDTLLPMVPGMSQQQIETIAKRMSGEPEQADPATPELPA